MKTFPEKTIKFTGKHLRRSATQTKPLCSVIKVALQRGRPKTNKSLKLPSIRAPQKGSTAYIQKSKFDITISAKFQKYFSSFSLLRFRFNFSRKQIIRTNLSVFKNSFHNLGNPKKESIWYCSKSISLNWSCCVRNLWDIYVKVS